ncbi:MAG: hypothetical protein KJ626_02160 [Verrucomicrobia bacterium]|nr:hypothetical protein [Verrucomicrobiota bacterium]
MKTTAIILVLCVAAASFVSAAPTGFDRYQIIIDKKPFGKPPPPPAVPTKPFNPADSFAKSLRMSAVIELDDGTMKVGIIDLQTKASFYLAEGEAEEGIELVSASWDDEEAVVRKGSEMALIKLQSGEITAITEAEHQDRMSQRRQSYADRRAARQSRRPTPTTQPAPEPKYSGDELTKHLQEYQMEVIRQGLPPLPIPLTQEMDDQLVTEGVLPPTE